MNKYYFHRDQAENVALINDMVAAAKQHNVGTGVYTTERDWNEITNGTSIDNLELWYVHTKPIGHPTAPDFSDFSPFANFKTPQMKQYSQSEWICNALVDRDVYRDEPRNN
ncbi:unnamed protein product [Heligmosomoides polygyrus]|nr:unnamed protein product [Heligmosomoides polygyrus]